MSTRPRARSHRSGSKRGGYDELDARPSAEGHRPPHAVLALQASVGNRAVTRLVQRYSVVNPADYTLGVGSEFASQQLVVGGGSARYVRNTRQKTTTGTLDSTEQAAGANVWNKTADQVPSTAALPSIKYGTDGTEAIAVEHTTAEPKVFYATPAVIAQSNQKLDRVGADIRLADAGGALDAPKDPASPAGPKLNLKMIKPAVSKRGQPPAIVSKFGEVSECNTFIKYVVGELTERVAVFGGGHGHEAAAKDEKEPTQAIANFAATNPGGGDALAAHLTATNTTKGDHDQALPAAYTGLVNKNARDQALGINKHAKAGVGEGYVITQGAPMPGDVKISEMLAALDRKIAALPLTAAQNDILKQKWGYHYAGIVAAVGDDAISFENYNRGTVKSWAADDLFMNAIATVADLRAHLNTLDVSGKTVPSIPKLRVEWFKKVKGDLAALGAAATAAQQNALLALQAADDGAKGTEISDSDLWHFKMYGGAPGQSFHEQWQGSLEDPMTLRIRQADTLTKPALRQDVLTKIGAMRALHPAGSVLTELARIEVLRLGTINAADGPKAIQTAYADLIDSLRRAQASAMRSWAVDAAALVGKKNGAVPPAPTDLSMILRYGNTLDQLLTAWEAKGWAVRASSKAKLAARRAAIAALKVKIAAMKTAV